MTAPLAVRGGCGGPPLWRQVRLLAASCHLLSPLFLQTGLTYTDMQAEKLLGPVPSRANCYVLPRPFMCSFIHS